MNVYAVFGLNDAQTMKNNINVYYSNSHFDAGEGVFFICSETETTQEVAEKIGFGNNPKIKRTSGIIVPVYNYWGRHTLHLWEWINAKQRA